jgi:chromosomal replication initiator protein
LNPLFREIFDGAKDELVRALGRHRFLLWFRDAAVERVSGSVVTLAVPTDVHRTWLEYNYGPLLAKAFGRVLGDGVTVEVRVSAAQEAKRTIRDRLPEDARAWAALLGARRPGPSLAAYACEDEAARFVVRLLQQTVHGNAEPAPPPIYLYGEPGSGKTHLLRGLHAAVEKRAPGECLYWTAKQMTSRFVGALRTRERDAVRGFEAYVQGRRLVLLDGVDELEHRPATQHELETLIDRARAAGQGVRFLFAGRRHPRDLPGLSPRLASRLLAGIVRRLVAPDRERLGRLLADRARAFGTTLPDEVRDAILARDGSVAGAVDALDRWAAVSATEGRPVGTDWLEEIAPPRGAGTSRDEVVRRAKEVVVRHYGVRRALLDRPSKHRSAVVPRRVAMYLVYRSAAMPLEDLGKAFGLKSHSSVSRALHELRERRDADPSLEAAVDGLLAQL